MLGIRTNGYELARYRFKLEARGFLTTRAMRVWHIFPIKAVRIRNSPGFKMDLNKFINNITWYN